MPGRPVRPRLESNAHDAADAWHAHLLLSNACTLTVLRALTHSGSTRTPRCLLDRSVAVPPSPGTMSVLSESKPEPRTKRPVRSRNGYDGPSVDMRTKPRP